ncbi:hypothetical protein [Eubacterium sp. BIOML-A1]|nr:hypothetical protein [Eubacterium sp. BIOML-A1]
MLGWAGVEEGYLPEMADASAEGIHADASAISGRLGTSRRLATQR